MQAADWIAADWIAADWGTSNLRLWAIGPEGEILAERSSADGMGGLTPDKFEPALLRLADDLLAPDRVTPVLICGMAGAKQGWIEAPYAQVPCPPAFGGAPVVAPTGDARISVRIMPGLCQSGPADVMRGEETQIAGFLADEPDFDGTLCLPGTHTKWVRVAGGQVLNFRTAMTGEIFALIGQHSVLRHSLASDGEADEGAFFAALATGFAEPAAIGMELFSIRPASLLEGLAPASATGRLSGLLIGTELAGAQDFWQNRDVVVVGSPRLTRRYIAAMERLGGSARAATNPELALSGLIAAHQLEQA
ncbi:2-keto-3-deoxygalactonate kinase [Pseudooceanicola antarcticus]|uniref:2-keto-3-deoxygalactonate kinase n=1 Tax=Pseudooceanicola antarcticus TaxID=1247613 RepID=A0A285IQ10_9RHOB|nr:2-dehydro-3-deoxygalactonokinase [Pseudooceanicola antarcticus]SNY50044.1 2-keto-3-deoxygalactonate kinase [Pseudooceanicola antarcticus]